MRSSLLSIALTPLLLLGVACSSGEPAEVTASAQPSTEMSSDMPGMEHEGAGEIPPDAQHLRVIGTEFAFAPEDPSVESDRPIAITFENDGTTDHDWTVHSADGEEVAHVHATAGQSAMLVVQLDPGTYEVWCTVAGHKEAGMVGTLEVS